MPYYDTIEQDLQRAKAILAKGQPSTWETAQFPPDVVEALRQVSGGTIYGADIYAAYKLLESFVAIIEAVGPDVCATALRAEARHRARHEP